MKTRLIQIIACVVCVALTGCTLTPTQKKSVTAAVGVGASLLQSVADIALKTVIAKAGSGQDLTAKANFIDSAAYHLRTLESQTGGLLTVDRVAAVVTQATDPNKAHWNQLAEKVATQILSSKLPPDTALEQAAAGLNAAAAEARSNAVNP